MNIKELQRRLNETIKLIKESGCYIDQDFNVCKDEEIYCVSVSGTFYNEYMGDGDWRYTEVDGDIVISDEIAQKLIDNIIDVDESEEKDEDRLAKASNLLEKVFENYDFNYDDLYCIEYAEFHDVSKENNVVTFHDKRENKWDISIRIGKKKSKEIKSFKVLDEKFGCM